MSSAALIRWESNAGRQHSDIQLLRLDERFFEDIMPTLRAFRGLFENVIRHARISAGYPIEKMIKMKLGALGIAAFAALNQSLGLVYCRTLEIPQPVPRQMDQKSRAWGAEFSARARRLHKNSFQRPRWRQRGRRPGTFIDHERKESQQHLSL